VLSESADFLYKCTALYSPECEQSVRYDDPAIGIEWPVSEPVLSAKDCAAPLLAEVPLLPVYKDRP
jgi:dTDP-4-dehydrorhamnose 3,5-epimerase